MCMHVPMEARRWLWISGVRGEAPDVSARIQTQILCERSTHSQLPRSLSSPSCSLSVFGNWQVTWLKHFLLV